MRESLTEMTVLKMIEGVDEREGGCSINGSDSIKLKSSE